MNKRKILRNIGIGILVFLIVIQFYHSKRNLSNDYTSDISKTFSVPDDIKLILKTSCEDCHSNATVYPWYSNIQPVDWWLQDHVDEGKKELNFSEFGAYRIYRQYRKFEEIIEQLKENEMPLKSYLLIHNDAKLNETQKSRLLEWANTSRDEMKAKYPEDSLVNPKKRKKVE